MSPPPSYHDIPGTVPAHQGVSRGPPPSYEEAVDPNGIKTVASVNIVSFKLFSAEPPSYDSLFGRIRDTHKASRNVIDFVVKVILLLLGTIGCTIACSITVVIPFCMIVIGSVYFHDCPAEPYIPIFLIVGGNKSLSAHENMYKDSLLAIHSSTSSFKFCLNFCYTTKGLARCGKEVIVIPATFQARSLHLNILSGC